MCEFLFRCQWPIVFCVSCNIDGCLGFKSNTNSQMGQNSNKTTEIKQTYTKNASVVPFAAFHHFDWWLKLIKCIMKLCCRLFYASFQAGFVYWNSKKLPFHRRHFFIIFRINDMKAFLCIAFTNLRSFWRTQRHWHKKKQTNNRAMIKALPRTENGKSIVNSVFWGDSKTTQTARAAFKSVRVLIRLLSWIESETALLLLPISSHWNLFDHRLAATLRPPQEIHCKLEKFIMKIIHDKKKRE